MKKFLSSIYGRIAFLFLILLVILGVVQIIFILNFSSKFFSESDQKLNRYLARDLAASFKPFLEDTIDYNGIKHSFKEMMVLNPRVEYYLLDHDGKILAYFADPDKIKRSDVDLSPIQVFLQTGDNLQMPLYGDDPRGSDRKKPFSVAPVHLGKNKEGYLYVILGGEDYDSARAMVEDSYIIRTSTVVVGVIFILTALIGLLLFFFLTRRLRLVTREVNNFAKGKHASRIDMNSDDEIGQLADAFNKMADTIEANIEEIKNNDRLRRDLIANISHDLRSPLASIQGYLETIMMKEKKLSEEERQHYLQTVYKNILRLNKLVYELLELSKLDAGQIKPKPEPFSIAELTQDVVLKFKPQADKHRINIHSDLPSALPMVQADIGMIERALSNLLENALSYTPEEGNVTIELQCEKEKVFVKVHDSGQGIDQKDIPFIFDRFYRADKSRSSEGTGLGLAITKKIMEAHNCNILVQSELNKGTTFTFDLQTSSSVH
jgi:signal transduction histidine kinase